MGDGNKLYMSGNVYEAARGRQAKSFVKQMEKAHGKNVTVSATYQGTPCYVQGGELFLFSHRMAGADDSGLDWMSRMRSRKGEK